MSDFKSFQEEMAEYNPEEEKYKVSIRAFLPVLGLFLIIALGAVSFVLSEPATEWLRDTVDNIPNEDEVQYVVGGIVFLVLVLLSGFLYALFAPKPKKRVTEAELKKERMQMQREKRARKKRLEEINRKKGEELRKKSK